MAVVQDLIHTNKKLFGVNASGDGDNSAHVGQIVCVLVEVPHVLWDHRSHYIRMAA